MPGPQSYSNHVRVDRAFLALTVLNLTLLIAAGTALLTHHDLLHWLVLGLALSTASTTMAARRYAITNQNRTIRLEETMRLQHLGVPTEGLSMRQLIALRFASDAEMPALVRRATTEQLDPKAIKQAIQTWRADHERV